MDFRTELFQRRFLILNADHKWNVRDYLNGAIKILNDICCWETDYQKDAYFTTKIDAKWEKLRKAFFGDVTPEGWN